MLGVFFAILAATVSGEAEDARAVAEQAPPAAAAPTTQSATVEIGEGNVIIGQNTLIEGAPAQPPAAAAPQPVPAGSAFNMDVVPAGLTADPQTPTRTFTTTAEVKPILNATKGNWVAVREYEGQDLLYITHLWSWRCGLKAIAISINGETMQNWPMPPCHTQFAAPNAILPEDGLPYLTLRHGSVETIAIQIVYDDLSMETATFERSKVQIPQFIGGDSLSIRGFPLVTTRRG